MNNKKIIIYDFDGTLTPYKLPKFEILDKCGIKEGLNNPIIRTKAQEKVNKTGTNLYEALHKTILEVIKANGYKLTDENICLGYDKIDYNKGVFEYLETLTENGIKNYILSSGTKVFIEKTDISKYFEYIYDDKKEIIDLKELMTPQNKVQAIKEIMKLNNEKDCSNIIYIGDGLTDYYAMEYVIKNNGISIFVYEKEENKEQIKEKDVVTFSALKDYSKNTKLYNYVMNTCNIKK